MVITTAQIPGRKAPVLVTTAMVEGMSEGSVIVDMAADSGGNCELSVAGEDVRHHGVTVVGMSNPPASMPTHASFLYARNIANFLGLLVKDGRAGPGLRGRDRGRHLRGAGRHGGPRADRRGSGSRRARPSGPGHPPGSRGRPSGPGAAGDEEQIETQEKEGS